VRTTEYILLEPDIIRACPNCGTLMTHVHIWDQLVCTSCGHCEYDDEPPNEKKEKI